ncbi:MAG TPA: lanthionine synthetase C family protein, partial [Thermoanaerobaculia bacterium]|nr:lanthionine synthetase C family protein [Thermoanaerobaculia bacterium]
MSPASRWQPLLPEDLACKAMDLAEEIAVASEELPPVLRRYRPGDRVALTSGWAGRALFLAYLEQARPGRGWGDRAVELLDQAIEELSEVPADPGLYAGFTGVAWVLEHLQGRLIDGSEDPGEEIASAVEGALRASARPGGFDLISGVAGLGVYVLERGARPGARDCLCQVVDYLAQTADRRDGTAGWRTPPDRVPVDRKELFPDGYYFTGVAHGVAGVIALLAEAQAAGVEARPLLDEAVTWLLRHKLPAGEGPVYPAEVAPAAEPRPTRLAWCHGDPGIAAALLGAARRAGVPEWEGEAVALARHSAGRSAAERNITDASLCHGSAGLMHLFNRLFQATGEPGLADAARFWFDRTLELRRPGQGVA